MKLGDQYDVINYVTLKLGDMIDHVTLKFSYVIDHVTQLLSDSAIIVQVTQKQTPRMNTVCGLYPQAILTDDRICQAIFNFGRGNFPPCRGTWRETSKSNKSQTIEQSYFLISPASFVISPASFQIEIIF